MIVNHGQALTGTGLLFMSLHQENIVQDWCWAETTSDRLQDTVAGRNVKERSLCTVCLYHCHLSREV